MFLLTATEGYLNARILLHRPFLAASPSKGILSCDKHVDPCLDAARETIRILYDSYANRHYFRTWSVSVIEGDWTGLIEHVIRWYNSTYTLYAGMIVLYIVLLDSTKISGEDLLCDVRKSRDILLSMEEASVARRSAELMSEVLEVAKTVISQRRGLDDTVEESRMNSGQSSGFEGQTESQTCSYVADEDISKTLFSHSVPGQNRGELLATLIDPTVLEDFAAGNNNPSGLDLSVYAMDGFMEGSIGNMRTNDLGLSIGYWWNGEHLYGNHGLA
jgi:hypothetical protein